MCRSIWSPSDPACEAAGNQKMDRDHLFLFFINVFFSGPLAVNKPPLFGLLRDRCAERLASRVRADARPRMRKERGVVRSKKYGTISPDAACEAGFPWTIWDQLWSGGPCTPYFYYCVPRATVVALVPHQYVSGGQRLNAPARLLFFALFLG